MESPELKAIIKYINMVFKPDKIDVRESEVWANRQFTHTETIIDLYFDKIDDKYLTNPYAVDVDSNKETNLEKEIRKDIESYFGVKTSGLSIEGFSPYQYHGLTIGVTQRPRSIDES